MFPELADEFNHADYPTDFTMKMTGFEDDNDNWEYEYELEFPYGTFDIQVLYAIKSQKDEDDQDA
jgi:hypothetical protein